MTYQNVCNEGTINMDDADLFPLFSKYISVAVNIPHVEDNKCVAKLGDKSFNELRANTKNPLLSENEHL